MDLIDEIVLKDFRDIKSKIKIEKLDRCSIIFAIVQDTIDVLKNRNKLISCINGDNFNENRNGMHNIVYDLTNDTYSIECVDIYTIGTIPFSCVAKMEGIINWSIKIPIPEIVFKKYLSDKNKKDFETWKSQYKDIKYQITYLQLLKAFP